MKKLIILSMMLLLIVSLAVTPVLAESVGDILLIVDDEIVHTDVPPVIINDRTLVPLRVLAEMVQCKVEWNGDTQSVVVYTPVNDDALLVMTIGDPNITVNWYDYETGDFGGFIEIIDVPPLIINDRTMVPVRFVAEALGYKVEWDAIDNAVLMYSPWYFDDPVVFGRAANTINLGGTFI